MQQSKVIFLMFLGVVSTACSYSQDSSPAVIEVKGLKGNSKLFKIASRDSPALIKSKEEALLFFSADDVEKIEGKMNFANQKLLVFPWLGSGQDKLVSSILESFPEQFRVEYRPGRTRDLKPHVVAFALRDNVIWKGKSVRPDMASGDSGKDEFIKVEVKGKLNSQVQAIGGETTGVQITAKGVTWELDFGRDKKMFELARELNGKVVIVKGELTTVKGVEIRKRTIVKVTSFRSAE